MIRRPSTRAIFSTTENGVGVLARMLAKWLVMLCGAALYLSVSSFAQTCYQYTSYGSGWYPTKEAACSASAPLFLAAQSPRNITAGPAAINEDTCRIGFVLTENCCGDQLAGTNGVAYNDIRRRGAPCFDVVEVVKATEPQSCASQPPVGNPIYPLIGAKKELVSTGIGTDGLELLLTYDSTEKLAPVAPSSAELSAFGLLWKSNYHRRALLSQYRKSAIVPLGDGTSLSFIGDGLGNFFPSGAVNHRLTAIAGGGVRFENALKATVETFDSTGRLISLTKAKGGTLTFGYTNSELTQVQDQYGRQINFVYVGGLITSIIDTAGRSIQVGYDVNKNLVSLTWPDSRVIQFVYENSTLPWALTGVIDENGSRYSTFSYDPSGSAISSQHANGVDGVMVTYATPAQWQVVESYDESKNILFRSHFWQAPTGTTVTGADGQTIVMGSQIVGGKPSLIAQSQPAGSGCAASSSGASYDIQGNVVFSR